MGLQVTPALDYVNTDVSHSSPIQAADQAVIPHTTTDLVWGQVGVARDDLLILRTSVSDNGQAMDLAVNATAATLPDAYLNQIVELKPEDN